MELSLRAAQASQEAEHFGGPKDYVARGQKMLGLGASLIGCTETAVTARGKTSWSGRASMQKGLGKSWKRTAYLALCVFYQATKYKRSGSVRTVAFGPKSDIWHGALIVPFTRKDSGTRIDVGEVHIRPKTVASEAQKRSDVSKALKLVNPKVPTILMGDWSGNRDAQLKSAGFTRVSLSVDTYDLKGTQKIDAIYVNKHLKGDTAKLFNPGVLSDHKWVSARISRTLTTT